MTSRSISKPSQKNLSASLCYNLMILLKKEERQVLRSNWRKLAHRRIIKRLRVLESATLAIISKKQRSCAANCSRTNRSSIKRNSRKVANVNKSTTPFKVIEPRQVQQFLRLVSETLKKRLIRTNRFSSSPLAHF